MGLVNVYLVSLLALIIVRMFMLNLLIAIITTTPGLDRCEQNRDVHGWLGRKGSSKLLFYSNGSAIIASMSVVGKSK